MGCWVQGPAVGRSGKARLCFLALGLGRNYLGELSDLDTVLHMGFSGFLYSQEGNSLPFEEENGGQQYLSPCQCGKGNFCEMMF